ncbi:MAG: hypothetical protein WD535_01720 [Thermaerobacterales bacterium]
MFALFLPLIMSAALMNFAQQLVNAGIARLPAPEISLAAYGVVLAVSVFLEAPVITMIHASNALVRGRQTYALVFLFMVILGGGLSLLHFAVAVTPLYPLVFERLMGLPPEVADLARPAFLIMTPWTLAIAWRRFFQGILVSHGDSRSVGFATASRLLTVMLVIAGGFFMPGVVGVTVGAVALAVSVTIEALVTTWLAWPLRRKLNRPPGPAPSGGAEAAAEAVETGGREPGHLTWPDLFRFYGPLATTMLLQKATPPILVAFIARAPDPALHLAAWPVAWGLMMLFGVATAMLSQIVIPLVRPLAHRLKSLRFSNLTGLALSGIMAVIAFSPAGHWYFSNLIGVKEPVLSAVTAAARALVIIPVLMAVQNALYGVFTGLRQTWQIMAGSGINMVSAVAAAVMLVTFLPWGGTFVAAAALAAGFAVELLALRWWYAALEHREALTTAGKT